MVLGLKDLSKLSLILFIRKTEVLSEFERGALKIKLLGHQDRYRAREKREEPGIDWPAVEAEGRSLGTLVNSIESEYYFYFSRTMGRCHQEDTS